MHESPRATGAPAGSEHPNAKSGPIRSKRGQSRGENASLKHLSVPVSCDRVRLGGIARYAPFVGSVMLVGSGCSSHLLS